MAIVVKNYFHSDASKNSNLFVRGVYRYLHVQELCLWNPVGMTNRPPHPARLTIRPLLALLLRF